MRNKEYRLRPEISEDIKSSLASYSTLSRKLLFHRGIVTAEGAETFLYPDYESGLSDPSLLSGIDKAVQRISEAVRGNEKILIYSDYDADGIPGGIILREFFEKINYHNVENYIPHRHDEGYGLHLDAVETLAESGAQLLITVDCGIVDFDQVKRAQDLGLDVIITDHHEPNGELPPAYAIINPKQPVCQYPFKDLCGAGVVFKLIQALIKSGGFPWQEGKEKWFLDLVGIATLSDMVPLYGENRVLAHYGLKVLRKSPRPGLHKLWGKLGVDQKTISADDIVFSLSPRINAASRMGHPMDAFRLLSTRNYVEADQLSDYLNRVNDERKGVVAGIVKEIKKGLEKRKNLPAILVMGNPKWRPAVLGLAANSVIEDFQRPVFLWGRNGDEELKGSCRSEGATNVVALMEATRDSFLQFGGHRQAGGFSITNEKVHYLEEELNKAYDQLLLVQPAEPSEEVVWVDGSLRLENVSWQLYEEIEKFAPFGVGNPKPIFLFENVKPRMVRQFGKVKNHTEVLFEDSSGRSIRAISFFSSPESFKPEIKEGVGLNLVASIEKSVFRNYPELRLRIVDTLSS